MNVAELLPSLFINLMSLFRKNVQLGNLTFPQAVGVYIIPDQGIEMSILSKKIGVDLSTLSRLINGLEKKNLVKRVISQEDRRIVRVYLKVKGVIIRKKIDKRFNVISEMVEQKIDDKRDYTKESLTKLNWEISKIILNNEGI
tara:strand:+ start:976 stop:1404 length:429 start_codon:yes stop_codon:yes gene_type:complete